MAADPHISADYAAWWKRAYTWFDRHVLDHLRTW